jgi:hypothetical protein
MARFRRLFVEAQPWTGVAAVILAAAAIGCGRDTTPQTSAAGISATYNKATGRLERIAYDRNHDGRPDAWLNMRGTHAVSAELDDNADGVIDRREYYADAAVAPVATTGSALPARTELVRAEQSTRGDGTMNRREFYEHGQLARVEEDTNGDGRVDKWETWSDGALRVLALDTKGAGRPDRRIVYGADGSNPQLEVDTKGDGTFTPSAQ